MKKYDYYAFLKSRILNSKYPDSLKNFYSFKEMWIKYLDPDDKVPSDYRLMYLFIRSCPRIFHVWNEWKTAFKCKIGNSEHTYDEWIKIAKTEWL